MRSALYFSMAATLLCLVAGVRLAHAEDEDARLTAFFREHLEAEFRLQPMEATRLGDHRFDDQLEDLSAAGRERWTAHTRQTLAALPQRIDYAKLTRNGQIDYEILQHDLTYSLWLTQNTHPFAEDPRVYNDYISDSVFLLLTQSTLPKETNLVHCLARMEAIPRLVAAAEANLANPPRAILETAIRQNEGAIRFFRNDLFTFAGATPRAAALHAAANRVAACLEQYGQFLQHDLLPQAHGEWRLGEPRFARKLELELDAGVTADQLFAEAQTEFARVQDQMWIIARQLWSQYFPRRPFPADDPAGRRQAIGEVLERIGKEHGPARELVRDARATVARLKRFIRDRNLLALPAPDRCQVITMPEFERGNSTAYMNAPPPLDPKASGYYAVSPPPKDWSPARVASYLEEYNRHLLQILTIHEAYPGHYVQLEYANRNPSLIRRVLGSGVYIEGWAVYTEGMMLDQGYGEGSLALRLTQLKFYLRAVANTLLDHQMHCTAMTDDEALRFLGEQAYQSEGEARLKILRAKQSSVQLSTYFAGRSAFYHLHQTVERELGSRFDLAQFHAAALAPGPVPVKYLPELVGARLGLPHPPTPTPTASP